MLQDTLDNLISVTQADYDATLSHVEHEIACEKPPAATIRLHFVRTDANGEPRFRNLARLLVRYITLFCFKAERRKDLTEVERNEAFMQARDLFRNCRSSGQAGELLVYFLLETVLHAPQVLKKMTMTTNPKEERKGSDGVHMRWIQDSGVLEIIFAESKLWKSFAAALTDAFKSMEQFHESPTKAHEINAFTSGFSCLDQDLQQKVLSYVEGENSSNCRFVHACLIGFDWQEYECLEDERREGFIKYFEDRYRAWADEMRDSLNGKLKAFKHKHLQLEFFMLPFKDVEAFRGWFNEELTGNK